MLQAKDIHKFYHHAAHELHVLKGIDLNVERGDVLAVMGPSGAGKSTLLHILGGLDRPQKGQVLFDGQDMYRLKERELAYIRNQKVGFIFQFYHLLPEFTALENVILPSMIAGVKNNETVRRRGKALLDQVGVGGRERHKPFELSGGEQQRVAIARALMNEPKVIFCDEPTGNLDSETGKAVIDLLLSLNRQKHQTLVIVTHDEMIARQAHKIVRLRDGSLDDKNTS